MRSSHRSLLIVALVSSFLGAEGVRAQDTDAAVPAAPREPARAALILFVSYRGHLPVFPDPTGVRRAASRLVADALAGPDLEVVTYPEIESTMRKWRVRSERDLGSGVLGALAAELDLESVVIGTLIVAPARVVLLIRQSSLETWDLRQVDVLEERTNPDLWDDPEAALRDLGFVVGRAVGNVLRSPDATPPSLSRQRLVMLPLRPIETDRSHASLVMHGVLGALLDTGRWAVSDPAVTEHALREAGLDPLSLGPRARAELAEGFNAETLLVVRLVAFQKSARTRQEFAEDERASFGPTLSGGVGVPFLVSVVGIDSRTGGIVTSADAYLAPDIPYGTFGRRREIPVVERFLDGAEALVSQLFPEGRE